jgi:hypothetical protein
MTFLSFALTFMGFVMLSQAMPRHYSQARLQRKNPPKKHQFVLRTSGSACLIAACVICTTSKGIAVGLVYWTGLITLAVFILTLFLTYYPQRSILAALVVLMFGVATGLVN